MSVAPKQWTVKIVSPPARPLGVLRDGVPLPAEIGPGLTTPVEVLLVSIGTCFALSCWAAFATQGLERVTHGSRRAQTGQNLRVTMLKCPPSS